jgi:hypothetical protein
VRQHKEAGRDTRGQSQFTLAAIVFVALMFLTISAVNIYMESDRSIRQAGAADASDQERAGRFDAREMDRSSASR